MQTSIPVRRYLTVLLLTAFHLNLYSNKLPGSIYEFEITVLDEAGKPLSGVSVFTDDQKTATYTDDKGKAMLKDVGYRDDVNFTYVGYQPLKMPFFEIKKRNGILKMYRAVSELKEVVVIGRRDDMPSRVPYTYDKVSKEDIAMSESQTTADALNKVAGVFVQKTQMGGGSPVLRGFEANRVLLVVDGVRMNTAIYRSGHLQNSITVDNGMLERMEVIYGPGSMLYGSDALGGVIHFRSKEPRLNFDDAPGSYHMDGNLYARYASANTEKSLHADIGYGRRRWASITSLTFTDYGDMRTGSKRPAGYEDFGKRLYFIDRESGGDVVKQASDPNLQVGTAYSQLDFMQKIKFQPSRNFYTILNFQQSTSSDVPRYDFLNELTDASDPTSLRYAEWYYGPQRRLLSSLKSRLSKKTALFDRATFIAGFQRTHENRLQRRRDKSQRTFQLEDVWAYTFTGDFDKNIGSGGQNVIMYGVDGVYNHVTSEAGKVKLSDESLTQDALPRYPATNDVTLLAGYFNYQWNTKDTSFSLHGGLRYNYAKLQSQYAADSTILWPANYIDPGIGSTNTDLTWSAGATWRSHSGMEVRILGSKAFRSPNIDDYSQLRPQNGFISIPNPALLPERSYNGELALAKQFGKVVNGNGTAFRLDLSGYYTVVKGLMTRRAFPLPDGSNLLEMEGELLETRASVNARKGIIYGGSAEAQLRIGDRWNISSNLTYTHGVSEFSVKNSSGAVVFDTLVPLDHIPPLIGMTAITFQAKKLTLSAVARYQGRKEVKDYGASSVSLNSAGQAVLNRGGTEDNLEQSYFKLDENGKRIFDGTLAWTTYNLYASWKMTKWYTLNFAVENLLDLHYRPFSSGVSAAGRNFILAFRVNLSK